MYEDRKEFIAKLKNRFLDYSINVVRFIDTLSKDLSSRIIAQQLLRSATSIGANFIEAQAASSKKDFINFLTISLKSANETQFWFSILLGSRKSNIQRTEELLQETKELSSLLGSIVKSLKKKV